MWDDMRFKESWRMIGSVSALCQVRCSQSMCMKASDLMVGWISSVLHVRW